MKFNRKGKTIFAIALTACMAGMAFSALPLFSVHADGEKLQCTEHNACDKNGFNKEGPCKTYTFTADSSTKWSDLEEAVKKVTCTGWTFDGWYTSPLEYTFWGGREKIFGNECDVLFPEEGWKSALEFAEFYKGEVKGIPGNIIGSSETEDSNHKTVYYFKELFNQWLTRFKEEKPQLVSEELKCDSEKDKEIIEKTKEAIKEKKVTSENLSSKLQGESTTLYARMKPDTVKVNFYADRSELNGWSAKAGCYVTYGTLYTSCNYPFGTPLGELFQNVSGLTVKGWRKSATKELVKSDTYMWEQGKLSYAWSDQILNEKFATRDGNGWKVDLVAIMNDETEDETAKKVESEKQEKAEQEKSTQQKDVFKSAANGAIEADHQCGNGVLVVREATCKEEGVKAHFKCSCGLLYWDQSCTRPVEEEEDLVASTHHNMVKIQGKKATCKAAGTADRWVCNTCHQTFADAKGEEELTDYTIEALGHEYKTEANGTKVCTRCGDVDDSEKNAVQEEVKPQVQPQAQEQPSIEEEKKEEAPKAETKQEPKKEEVRQETQPEPKQESTEPKAPVVPEEDEEEEKEEVAVAREQQTRPRSKKSPRA